MSERGLSEEAMLASLRDIRLPDAAAGGMLADVAAVLALSALAALVLAATLRLLSRKRQNPQPETLAMALTRAAALPPEARRTVLLHLLRRHAPDRYAEVRGEIYAPGGGAALATLEEELRRCA